MRRMCREKGQVVVMASVIRRNNVMAGSFVLASIVLAVAIAVILGGIELGEKTRYVVRFPTSIGATGLQPGSEVTFGGLAVGRVTAVTTKANDAGVVESMDVEILVDSDLVLYEDAMGDLSPPLLGGVSKINIASPGTGAADSLNPDTNGTLDTGEVIAGRFAPSILMQLGFSVEDAEKLRRVIDNAERLSERATESVESVQRMVGVLEENFGGGVEDGAGALANIRAFTDNLNAQDGWSSRVDSILAGVDDAATEAGPVIEDAGEAVASARRLIDENSMRLSRTLSNVERITERVDRESMDKMDELLSRGALALGTFEDVGVEARGLLRENRPVVDDTLANARQLTLAGSLFLQEVRAQPWRLLKEAKESDLRREPLYEAARSYASSVSELREASVSLETAMKTLEDDRRSDAAVMAELTRLAGVVEGAYGRYENAERRLLELLSDPEN